MTHINQQRWRMGKGVTVTNQKHVNDYRFPLGEGGRSPTGSPWGRGKRPYCSRKEKTWDL